MNGDASGREGRVQLTNIWASRRWETLVHLRKDSVLNVGGKVRLSKKGVSGPIAGAKRILPLSLSQRVNKSFVRVGNDRARGRWLECIRGGRSAMEGIQGRHTSEQF